MSEIFRYVVRPVLVGDDALFGKTGVRSIVVRAADAAKAKALGAEQLGVPAHTLEVVKMETSGTEIPVLVDPEQIQRAWEKRGDQDTRYVGPA